MRVSRLLCSLLLLSPWAAMAQTEIHRCIGADGNPVFTDRACTDLDATPARPASSAAADAAAPAAGVPILCAADLAELKQAVIEAFASNDVNRLAGLMLWSGHDPRTAVAAIRALQRQLRQPLVGVDEGPPAAAPTGSAANAAPELLLRTAADDGSGIAQETRFTVVRRSGCLWLRLP